MASVNAYDIRTDPEAMDIAAIHDFLSTAYWSPGVPREVVARAVANSVCVGAFDAAGGQVGFARMVSDRATFAYLSDVYVLQAHRGHGLARRMVQALLAHPELQGLRRVMLATRDAHGLYAQLGWKPLAAPERFMEIHQPDVYGRAG
ncbi:MAG TPA: GNAT family N-acetyltransferase [Burkholderiaceae bacterium]